MTRVFVYSKADFVNMLTVGRYDYRGVRAEAREKGRSKMVSESDEIVIVVVVAFFFSLVRFFRLFFGTVSLLFVC